MKFLSLQSFLSGFVPTLTDHIYLIEALTLDGDMIPSQKQGGIEKPHE